MGTVTQSAVATTTDPIAERHRAEQGKRVLKTDWR
jgi:hypothetical protein